MQVIFKSEKGATSEYPTTNLHILNALERGNQK